MRLVPRKTDTTGAVVAASLDAPARALGLLPELLAPLTALGSQPRSVVGWLRAAGVRAGERVLDLGCGKGAVAVAVANRLACEVVGVDAFEPFIEEARRLAARRRVARRCDFRCERLERWQRAAESFDVVLMLGVWPLRRAARLAQRLTRAGGFYLIDDCVRVAQAIRDPRHGAALDAAGALRALQAGGDRVERWHVLSRAEARRHERTLYERIRAQAARMARRNPRQRPLLRECLRRQRAAIRDLTGPLRAALWLVRRG